MSVFDLFKKNVNITKVETDVVSKHTVDTSTPITNKGAKGYVPYMYGPTEDFSFLDKNIQTAKKIEVIDTAISYIASWFSQGILTAKDANGNLIENDPLIAKLKKPNPIESSQEFLEKWAYFTKANGKSIIKPHSKIVGFEKEIEETYLYNLNPDNIKEFQGTKSIFEMDKANDVFIFKEFLKSSGFSRRTITHQFNYDDVLVFVDNIDIDGNTSVLNSLRDEVKNIYLAQKGKTNKLERSGVIVVSPTNTKEGSASQGLDKQLSSTNTNKTQKDLIQERLNSSGTTSDSGIIISSTSLKAQNLTEGLNSLDYDKEVVEDYRRIYGKFGIPDELSGISEKNKSSNSLGDSGSKKEVALLHFLQNTIDPLGKLFSNTLTNFYDNGVTYKMSFNHLSPFQITENKKVEQSVNKIQEIKLALEVGLITMDEAKEKYKNN